MPTSHTKKLLPFKGDLILTANVGRGLNQAAFSRFRLTVLEDLISRFYWYEGPPQAPHIQVSWRSSKPNEGLLYLKQHRLITAALVPFVCTADKRLICRSPHPRAPQTPPSVALGLHHPQRRMSKIEETLECGADALPLIKRRLSYARTRWTGRRGMPSQPLCLRVSTDKIAFVAVRDSVFADGSFSASREEGKGKWRWNDKFPCALL